MLEQCLPDSFGTPFVTTMLKHFEKLHSPLRSLHQHPTVQDQESRFLTNGWAQAKARTLWDLWNDVDFMSNEIAEALNRVEPFDEWEEFALFGCHYFILTAKTLSREHLASPAIIPSTTPATTLAASFFDDPRIGKQRRYGASFRAGSNALIYHGGVGSQGRLRDTDLVASVDSTLEGIVKTAGEDLSGPNAGDLMCHTITSIGTKDCLLVGGRTSPERASATCLWRKGGTWQRAQDLPQGLFRHSAARVSVSVDRRTITGVLIFGGKTGQGTPMSQWLLWLPLVGWIVPQVVGNAPEARFGAAMCSSGFCGYISGGMTGRSTVLQDLWKWELIHDDDWKLQCTNLTNRLVYNPAQVFGRFGGTLLCTSSDIYLIGGVGQSYVPESSAILKVDQDLRVFSVRLEGQVPQPLLVGHTAELVHLEENNLILILGGGATCYSFGTYWNKGSYTISIEFSELPIPWQGFDLKNHDHATRKQPILEPNGSSVSVESPMSEAPRQRLGSQKTFEQVQRAGKPVIFEHLDLGPCTIQWTPGYLKDQVGIDRQVMVHIATSSHMNFLDKNFSYQTRSFGDFMNEVESGGKMYLRALSAERPADVPARLDQDFATIAPDFVLPPELAAIDTQNIHSSPLRISGPVVMWLHYDVMANVYCQIRGRKRMVLFPPRRVIDLQFPPGASSSQLNVFDSEGTVKPDFGHLEPVVCDLGPGDVLYIPAVWPHTAYPLDGIGVAVNVFFRSLTVGYAPGRDVYGNRDVQAYETGRKDVARITKAFDGLPDDISSFYLRRLSAELLQAAERK